MIIIDPNLNIAYIRHKGSIQIDGFINLGIKLALHPQYVPGINVLYDLRFTDFSRFTSADMKEVPVYLQLQGKNIHNRVAVVVEGKNDFYAGSIWQSIFKHLPSECKVFQSIANAEAWLFTDSVPELVKRYNRIQTNLKKVRKNRHHHVLNQTGTVLYTTVSEPLDGIPLAGRTIEAFLPTPYVYPFSCQLRRVLKTGKRGWTDLQLFNHEFTICLFFMDSCRVHGVEYDTTDMGAYAVERLKWEIDAAPPPVLPPDLSALPCPPAPLPVNLRSLSIHGNFGHGTQFFIPVQTYQVDLAGNSRFSATGPPHLLMPDGAVEAFRFPPGTDIQCVTKNSPLVKGQIRPVNGKPHPLFVPQT